MGWNKKGKGVVVFYHPLETLISCFSSDLYVYIIPNAFAY